MWPTGWRLERRFHRNWNSPSITEVRSAAPAYDICPRSRTGGEASQAMLINGENRLRTIANCLAAARRFGLSEAAASELIERQIETIRAAWGSVVDEAELTSAEAAALWRRQLLNPFAFEAAPARLTRFDRGDLL